MNISQTIVDGLVQGGMYAIVAVGYTMVYGVIGMINFAHGEVYMIGAFTGLMVMTGLALIGITSVPVMLLLALIVVIIVASATGVVIERVAYRPLRGKHRLIPLISAIGVSLFLQNYYQITQGSRVFAAMDVSEGGKNVYMVGEIAITPLQLTVLMAAIVIMILLSLFVSKTKIGWACRATEQDRRMANLLGINTDNIISLVFVIGSALAGIAGVLLSLIEVSITSFMGFAIGIKAFAAAVLGGIGSIPGAFIGGFIIGFAEKISQGSDLIGSDYSDVMVFGILLLILLVRPSGILGKPEIEKV
ncbi:MAG: branched-chain amino acid ABC transporter permease LivH [Gammaproteobacteria bacterium]|nr:MAG: branched-chain amino acid ABC transporter permease LivH [Gammaproteobacteria bacterium]